MTRAPETGRAPAGRALTSVAPGVWVATAVGFSTTSTLVVDDDACLVVDPALTPAEVDGLAATVRRRGWVPVAGFSTHPHWDHTLWTASLGDVPRWAAPAAAAAAGTDLTTLREEADETAPGHDHALTGRLIPVRDVTEPLAWGGATQVRMLTHRAHAPGHTALLIPAPGVLVAGDMLSDVEVPLLDLRAADPVADHHEALEVLAAEARAASVGVLVPGHGRVGDARELRRRLDADRRYLDAVTSGRDPQDDRLDDPWVRGEHARQVHALRTAGDRPPPA